MVNRIGPLPLSYQASRKVCDKDCNIHGRRILGSREVLKFIELFKSGSSRTERNAVKTRKRTHRTAEITVDDYRILIFPVLVQVVDTKDVSDFQ